jgi:uncharacterized protein YndB with AHSA1/START domain
MAANTTSAEVATRAGEREIVATRVFAAPRALVYSLWTDPRHITQWWGPTGFTTTIHEMDVRPGGLWRFVMHGPDGVNYQNKIIYREVVAPDRLVYDNVSGPQFHATVTFAEQGGNTRVTVRMLFASAADRERVIQQFGALEGLTQTLGRLEGYVARTIGQRPEASTSDQVIVITRVFDAPREAVFKAWTEPERLQQWWGPHGFTTPFCAVDLRLGGVFHYCMRSPEGRDIWGRGVYQDIVVPERIVYIDTFADADGHPVSPSHYGMSTEHPAETLVTVTFTVQGRQTKVTVQQAVPAAFPERSGTQQGWTEMLDRLADALANIPLGSA